MDEDRWTAGLSDEEMVDIAHHLGLQNFRGVLAKDRLPLFTKYVTEEQPSQPSTVIINTARSSEPGRHWVALHYQPKPNTNEWQDCDNACLVEYFDSYGVANMLPEINKFIEEVSPFNPVGYNYTNLQDFSDQQSVVCGYHCLYFAFMKHLKPDLCVTDIHTVYPEQGKNHKINELHVIDFMEHNLCKQ